MEALCARRETSASSLVMAVKTSTALSISSGFLSTSPPPTISVPSLCCTSPASRARAHPSVPGLGYSAPSSRPVSPDVIGGWGIWTGVRPSHAFLRLKRYSPWKLAGCSFVADQSALMTLSASLSPGHRSLRWTSPRGSKLNSSPAPIPRTARPWLVLSASVAMNPRSSRGTSGPCR